MLFEKRYMGDVCLLSSVLGIRRHLAARSRKVSKWKIEIYSSFEEWRNSKVADAVGMEEINREVEIIPGRLKGSRS